jgi:hypothetical protein
VSARVVRRWFDYRGGVFERPATDEATCWDFYDQRTHAMLSDGLGDIPVQALTRCGKRACPVGVSGSRRRSERVIRQVPGRGPVDCPECLEAAK